jgi:DedD protein
MGLLSFFQRKNDAPSAASSADAADSVALARTRARQRLVGAAVLVVIGVIGFPLIFETQPRPIPVDIPIEIPRKDNAPTLVMPAARPVATPAATASSVAPVPRDDAAAAPAAEPPKTTAIASAPAEPARRVEVKPEVKPATKVEAKAEPKLEPKPAAKPAVAPVAEAARARSALEGKEAARPPTEKAEPSKEASGRFVVQVGAFTDAAAVRDTRAKLDKLGLKSFTQPVTSDTGPRTRVRLGPFDSREQAEQALAKVRAAGLNAVVLTL